jgi:hypothetical protein
MVTHDTVVASSTRRILTLRDGCIEQDEFLESLYFDEMPTRLRQRAIGSHTSATIFFQHLAGLAHAAGRHHCLDRGGAGQRTSQTPPAVAALFLILNVALAVYKPGWRVRRGGQQSSSSRSEPARAYGWTARRQTDTLLREAESQ